MNALAALLLALADKYDHLSQVLYVEDGRPVRVSDLLRAEAEAASS